MRSVEGLLWASLWGSYEVLSRAAVMRSFEGLLWAFLRGSYEVPEGVAICLFKGLL